MWSMGVSIFFLFCYVYLSSGNGKVRFVSRNFYNILQWDPVEHASPGEEVLYSIHYWSDAKEEAKQIKEECQNITSLSCNLTAETPSVPDVHYWAHVFSNGSLLYRTNRFKPIAETILGPPILSKYTTVSSLHVNVTLPLGPKGVSVADIISSSKNGPSKTVIVYTLHITYPEWAALVNKTTTGQFIINLKNNQTKYCGYVVYQPTAEWGRPSSENASFCVTLPYDPLMLLPWVLVSAAILTAIIIMAVVCMCNYVKGGMEKSMPQLLITSSTQPKVLQSLDRNLIISKPEVCVARDKTIYTTIRVRPNMPSIGSGGYSPQDIHLLGSTGSSVDTSAHSGASNPEDTSAQSSTIYSVVAVHVPAEQNEDFQQTTNGNRETRNLLLSSSRESCDKGGASPNLTSNGLQPSPDLEPCENNPARALLLQTVRDTNGQLVLPLHPFQLQSSTDDTVSLLNPERKPLLSDLIDSKKDGPLFASLQSCDSSEWSDSGCDDSAVCSPTHPYSNNHYFQTQPVAPYFHQECQNTPPDNAIFKSGYKQNWMPASQDSCEYRKTNYPWTWTGPKKEKEDEDRGGEQILQGWMIQIQEQFSSL
ncbi:interferon lambda receptor 1 [Etheostoma cragini]|uniref:interferon lambda receptor 1 n=1 Tax=Etheostoma cragini TaxID=417921 RepID=UPI00155EB835|nr:interferon lambda receptor 1 [Etheostoma cragini]